MPAPLRLLHTADWQLGKQFSRFAPDDGAALSAARFAVVDRLAALARTHAVDLVLVAGDVFDVQDIGDTALRRGFLSLAAFDCPVLLLPGNHDADIDGGVFARAQRLGIVPEHVHLLCDGVPKTLLDGRVQLFSAPLRRRHEANLDIKSWASYARSSDVWRVGMAHGSVLGVLPEHYELNNVINPADVESANLDYLALGDWHGALQVNPRCAYSGTPEPDRFRANQAGFAYLVELFQDVAPKLTPLPTKAFTWHSLELQFDSFSDVSALAPLRQFTSADVVRVRFSGTLGAALEQELRVTLDALRARVRALTVEVQHLRFLPSDAELAELILRAQEHEVGSVMPELLAQLHAQAASGDEAAMDGLRLILQWQQEAR